MNLKQNNVEAVDSVYNNTKKLSYISPEIIEFRAEDLIQGGGEGVSEAQGGGGMMGS